MADINVDVVRGHGRSLIMPPAASVLSRIVTAESLRISQTADASVGGETPFFAADFSQTDATLVAPVPNWEQTGNSTNGHSGGYLTWGRQAGIGPNAEDAWRFQHQHSTPEVQYYCGWDHTAPYVGINGGDLGLPAFGAHWYPRMLIRVSADTNWRAMSGNSYTIKFCSFGEGGGGYTATADPPPDPNHMTKIRSIVQLNGDRNDPSTFEFRLQLDAAWGPTPPNVSIGAWHYIQLGLEGSSSVTGPDPSDCSADGNLKVWIDNGNYSAPTSEMLNIHLASQSWPAVDGIGWNVCKLGYFSNQTLDTDGIFTIDIAKFDVGLTFDPTWGA